MIDVMTGLILAFLGRPLKPSGGTNRGEELLA